MPQYGKVHFDVTQDKLPQLAASVAKLAKARVLVGIPQAEAARVMPKDGEQINNAQLLYIHTHGSPARGIPARPVIEPALAFEPNKEAIVAQMESTAQAVLSEPDAPVEDGLERTGIAAQNAIKEWFTNPANDWAPNSTRPLGPWLAAKLSERYGREITPQMSYVDAKGSDRPLIDTGAMRNAIVYVVDKDSTK